jgi:AcrR family transcriptional regulator
MEKKNLRQERKLQRRKENKVFILEAAENVFAQKGFVHTTMDDIADEAQFSKATIYRYYKSKKEIFAEIIMNSMLEIRQGVRDIQKKDLRAVAKVEELIRHILTYYDRKKNIARIFFMERSAMNKALNVNFDDHVMPGQKLRILPENFLRIFRDIFQAECEIIRQGVESGEFRPLDPKEACLILDAMLRGFYFKGPMPDKDYSLEEASKLLKDYFLHGIKSEKTNQ